jgi:hypothetical protein
MAEALDKPLPELAEDAFTRIGHEDAAGAAAGAAGGSAGGAGDVVEHVFEDPEVGQGVFGGIGKRLIYLVMNQGKVMTKRPSHRHVLVDRACGTLCVCCAPSACHPHCTGAARV